MSIMIVRKLSKLRRKLSKVRVHLLDRVEVKDPR